MALAATFDIESEAQLMISKINAVIANAADYLDETGVSDKSKKVLAELVTQLA